MAKGLSVHIGLNRVDPDHYHGWDGALRACEFDARDMAELAKKSGFDGRELLLTEDATADRVIDAISGAADQLGEDDMFLLTYSGHGGQVPDKNSEEQDRKDETWLCYDRQLVDDELFDLWSRFAPGTRIFVLSDSCHSGTVVRGFYTEELIQEVIERYEDTDLDEPRVRSVPEELRGAIYQDNKSTYDEIQQRVAPGDAVDIDAQVILISGCQDNQQSLDGARNGLFTAKLLQTWKDGKFKGYPSFARRIRSLLPPTQSPNYFKAGPVKRSFERQRPLTIESRKPTHA